MGSHFSGFIWDQEKTPSQRVLLTKLQDDLDETALVQYASDRRKGRKCHLISQQTMGGVHSIRIVEFDDGVRWLARIQLERSDERSARKLKSEVDTMICLQQRTKVPIPQIHGVELQDSNPIGRAFVLMECIPGNAVMDLDGGYEVHRGQILDYRKPRLYQEFADLHVKMTALRMPKIGTIVRKSNGVYDVGPIPGLGGPFATARDFFKQWAKVYSSFPRSHETIRTMCGDLADDILSSIQAFPTKLQEWADNPNSTAPGPFPLQHPDTYLSNVLANDDSHILALIDWEGAHTVPWEIVGVPTFLDSTPAPIDAPWNYDASGQPKDPGTQKAWKERDAYISYVKNAEKRSAADGRLSRSLLNTFCRHLSYVIREWPEGKVGYHDRIFR